MSGARRAMVRPSLALLAITALVCVPHPARAGLGVWTTHGPPAGAADIVVVAPSDPNVLYVSTASTVFSTRTAGARWRWAGKGLPIDAPLQALAVDPTAPLVAYVAMAGFGVFKTSDGGKHWVSSNVGLDNFAVVSIAVAPGDPETIYAGTDGSDGDVLYRSTDGGANWVVADAGIESPGVIAVVVDPTDPETVLVGTGSEGVLYRSTNGGESWRPSNRGLPRKYAAVEAIQIDPSDPSVVYAAVWSLSEPGGVFKSTDGGRIWTPASLKGIVTGLAMAQSEPSTLYAVVSPTKLFITTDEGQTWARVEEGLPPSPIRTVAVDPTDPDVAYAGSDREGGLFKTTNGGQSWFPASSGLAGGCESVAGDPTDPDVAYAGEDFYQGIFKTTDAGRTWAAANQGFREDKVKIGEMVVDPGDPETVYAAVSFGFLADGGVLKTTDGGAHWKESGSGLPASSVGALAIAPSDPSVLYTGLFAGEGGAFRSTDGATTWTPAGLEGRSMIALAVDPTDPERVYAGIAGDSFYGEEGGILVSTDGGADWDLRYLSPPDWWVQSIAVDPVDPEVLYAATHGPTAPFGVLLKSTDRGASWAPMGEGLDGSTLYDVVVDPADSSTVYSGGYNGAFVSYDAGSTWASISEGLVDKVRDLWIDHTGTRLYAGTCAGVFEYRTG